MSRKRNIKIFVAESISMKAARDIIAGVLRYAAAKRVWNVFVHGGHPFDRDDARPFSRPDGIITGHALDEPANPMPAGMRRNIPTVFTCIAPYSRMKAPSASIYADDQAIAAECGYGSPGTLRNAFRAQFGTTMRTWRASALD